MCTSYRSSRSDANTGVQHTNLLVCPIRSNWDQRIRLQSCPLSLGKICCSGRGRDGIRQDTTLWCTHEQKQASSPPTHTSGASIKNVTRDGFEIPCSNFLWKSNSLTNHTPSTPGAWMRHRQLVTSSPVTRLYRTEWYAQSDVGSLVRHRQLVTSSLESY